MKKQTEELYRSVLLFKAGVHSSMSWSSPAETLMGNKHGKKPDYTIQDLPSGGRIIHREPRQDVALSLPTTAVNDILSEAIDNFFLSLDDLQYLKKFSVRTFVKRMGMLKSISNERLGSFKRRHRLTLSDLFRPLDSIDSDHDPEAQLKQDNNSLAVRNKTDASYAIADETPLKFEPPDMMKRAFMDRDYVPDITQLPPPTAGTLRWYLKATEPLVKGIAPERDGEFIDIVTASCRGYPNAIQDDFLSGKIKAYIVRAERLLGCARRVDQSRVSNTIVLDERYIRECARRPIPPEDADIVRRCYYVEPMQEWFTCNLLRLVLLHEFAHCFCAHKADTDTNPNLDKEQEAQTYASYFVRDKIFSIYEELYSFRQPFEYRDMPLFEL